MEIGGSDQTVEGLQLHRLKSIASIADTLSPLRETIFVAAVMTAQFTAQLGLGQTIRYVCHCSTQSRTKPVIASILHVIGDWFHITNPGILSWLIAGYSLTVGSFILPSGRMGDVFGYKRMLLIGFLWYALWAMVAGLSAYSDHVLFIFARVLCGIGPSICLPNSLAILGATYPPGLKRVSHEVWWLNSLEFKADCS